VPGHMRIDGNEIADYLARESSSHPLRGAEHALGISAKVAMGVNGFIFIALSTAHSPNLSTSLCNVIMSSFVNIFL